MTLHRLSQGLIYFVFSFLLACGNKDEVKPLPAIYSLSRTEGYAGVRMKISGANFDGETVANNVVKFGNSEARVDSISKTELIVFAPETGSSGNVSVTTPGGMASGPNFRYYDIYILGSVMSNGKSSIGIWKNGVMDIVAVDAKPTAFYIDGNHIYVSGTVFDNVTKPAYWVNKVLQTFDPPLDSGTTTDITVANGSVYVSGIGYDGASTRPVYWKDGTPNYLSDALYTVEEASSITVVDGTVYVTGYKGKSDLTAEGTYWVDGSPFPLVDGANETFGKQIAVDHGDIYVMGTSANKLVYWKNDVMLDIEDGASSVGRVLKVFAGDVVIGGWENSSCCGPLGTIWVNGTKLNLFNGGATYVLSLDALNSDTFFAGYFYSSSTGKTTDYYAFNDKLFQVPGNPFIAVVDVIAK